jgi:choloylglycine hydrolase
LALVLNALRPNPAVNRTARKLRLRIPRPFADKPENADESVNLCQHVLNAFDMTGGLIVAKSADGKRWPKYTTQFASVRDLTHKVFYFRTYENLDLRKVDPKKLNFTRDKIKLIRMYGDSQSVKDVTFEAE